MQKQMQHPPRRHGANQEQSNAEKRKDTNEIYLALDQSRLRRNFLIECLKQNGLALGHE